MQRMHSYSSYSPQFDILGHFSTGATDNETISCFAILCVPSLNKCMEPGIEPRFCCRMLVNTYGPDKLTYSTLFTVAINNDGFVFREYDHDRLHNVENIHKVEQFCIDFIANLSE